MIIYPPLINDLIPAFINESSIIIKIPYEMNPAVNINDVKYMKLQIKDYLSSYVISKEVFSTTNFKDGYAQFVIEPFVYTLKNSSKEYTFPTVGQYYKLQIAYSDSESESFLDLTWSSASLGKCIGSPEQVYITNSEDSDEQHNSQLKSTAEYIGVYIPAQNSEPLYSYKFEFKDGMGNVLQKTDIKLYNNNQELKDNQYRIPFQVKYELEYGQVYNINFTITTINGYEITVSRRIVKKLEAKSEYDIELLSKINYNDAFVDLSIKSNQININGQFILERSDNKQKIWENITTFAIGPSTDINQYRWRDFSIEHGKTYYYRIKQFNNNNYSAPISTTEVKVKFEDMFLTDGEKQLKIRFDPKVSTFKDTILETKTDTIGGKYPYFFRNGQVGYKEIAISGLISYLMDENNFFCDDEELGLSNEIDNNRTINLVDYNIAAERVFREKVVSWLNNGEPKLFRSPTEGNYVLRLMNVSISPNDTLGRMIYSFSATGYECAAADTETLKDLGLFFITIPNEMMMEEQRQGTISNLEIPITNNTIILNNVKNFEWVNTNLSKSDSMYISLKETKESKEIKIYNYSGLISTPKDKIYYEIVLNGTNIMQENGSYFRFVQLTPKYKEAEDNFNKKIQQEYWRYLDDSNSDNKSILEQDGRILYYALITSKNNERESSFEIITEPKGKPVTIILDKQQRYYKDIPFYGLTVNNATAIVYYTEEVII